MSTRARMIRRLLIFLSLFSFVSGSWAQQDISTDPFLQDKIDRQHWAPGGQHYPSHFPIRGPTIEQTGQVNIHPLHTQRLGTYKLQNADVRGQYGFVIDLRSQHGHNVHAPFDYASEATKTFREDRKDGGQSSIELTSQGSFVHPANGYDPPAGGGFPPPDPRGAIDLVDFSINGIATGVYPLSLSEQQKSDIAPGLSGDALADRASNSVHQAYNPFTDQLEHGQGIATARKASDALLRGDPSNRVGAGQRLQAFNGAVDFMLSRTDSFARKVGGLAGGAFEAELIAAVNKIGNARVRGFKSEKDFRIQYARLQTSSDLKNFLKKPQSIEPIVIPISLLPRPFLKEGKKLIEKLITLTKGAKKKKISVDDLIKSSTPGRSTKGRSSLFDRKGGINQANKEFDALNPSEIKNIPGGRVGKLDDGRTVIIRKKSTDGRPTLEIRQGKNMTKFRFDD
uniref:Uncharacterized protein n=1 Tax=Candidatus Kentrum sp. LPFa TaxID=2126335 RepID=A0A450VZD3_9GAMM|nr:MAG: Protein of unknown function (DUF1020) [Candidatus Kentron sp. LPFa]